MIFSLPDTRQDKRMRLFNSDLDTNIFMRKVASPKIILASSDLHSNRRNRQLKQSRLAVGGGGVELFGRRFGCHLLGAFDYEGRKFDFSFWKFWKFPRSHFEMVETNDEMVWRVKQGNLRAIMITEIHCRKDELSFATFDISKKENKQAFFWTGSTAYGNVKLYARSGVYCKLLDDISVKKCSCEFLVYSDDLS